MSKSPAFLFYVDKFVQGTLTFTAEETGAYILLLCYQWDNIYVPQDEKKIRAIARLNNRNAKNVLQTVLQKFTLIDKAGYQNLRLEMEREKLMSKSEVYRKRAEEAANARWKKDATSNATSIPQASNKHSLSDAITITNTITSTTISDDIDNTNTYGAPIENQHQAPKRNTGTKPKTIFVPPTPEEVLQAFKEKKGGVWAEEDIKWQAEKFVLHYTEAEWKISGGKKMKDWKLSVAKWVLNNYDKVETVQQTHQSKMVW